MMLFNKDSIIQSTSRKFCTDHKPENLVPCQSSRRRVIPSGRQTVQSTIRPDDVSNCPNDRQSTTSSIRTMRTFCPDLPLCREASNCSYLHPFGRFPQCSTKALGFLSKNRYGKIAATVRMTWIPVRMRSSIRQVSQFKSRHWNASQHGPDACTSNIEIACIRSTVQTTILLVRTREDSIWKWLAADVRPSGRKATLFGRSSQTGKIFSEIFGISVAQLSVRTAYDNSPDSAQLYQARRSFEPLSL
jgi:hypothetical protein